jgi:hypothetical protein
LEACVAGSERGRELRRRRKRHEKVQRLQKRLVTASSSEKQEIARKLREMTPGAEVIISKWELQQADR